MGNLLHLGRSDGPTHKVIVKTGDIHKLSKVVGDNPDIGKVYAKISDGGKEWTDEHLVSDLWSFKPESTGEFQVTAPDHGKITDICIRRDGINAACFLEKVEIEHISSRKKSVFPVTRYLDLKEELYVSEFDSSLPQFSAYPEQRQAELEQAKKIYMLKEKITGLPHQFGGPSMPWDEHFNLSAKGKEAVTVFPDDNSKISQLDDLVKLYNDLGMEVPTGKDTWDDDSEFANQRLCGVNPVMIELCQKIPDGFAVTADMVKEFLEGKTLADAMARKKVYVVDLRYVPDMKIETNDNLSDLPGPIAMFYVKDSGDLICIAIQLMPEPAADNPVFLPSDPKYTWQLAKMWFNLADASHHWSVTHLGFTHLLIETVMVSMRRSLSKSHPVYRLLAPHAVNLLAINMAVKGLISATDGFMDHCMLMKHVGVQKFIARNWSQWNLKGVGHFKNHLKNRGVDDIQALPNYPYRDDAMLLWDAIGKYVTTVVNGIYDEPSKLADDWELQSWATRLTDANVQGVPERFAANDELIETITVLLFTVSTQHAAANFGQYNQYGYTPNYPLKLWGERPKDKNARTLDDIVQSVQGKAEITQLLRITGLLSMRGPDAFGFFDMQFAYDPLSVNALNTMQQDMSVVKKTIEERNKGRKRKYTDLDPSEVPNSISN